MRRPTKRDTDAALASCRAELQDTQERLGAAIVALVACEEAMSREARMQTIREGIPVEFRRVGTAGMRLRDALALCRDVIGGE